MDAHSESEWLRLHQNIREKRWDCSLGPPSRHGNHHLADRRCQGRIGPYADQIAFVVVIGALTFFSLVLGELVPKRLAMRFPEAIATTMAGPMSWLSRVASPFVALLSVSTSGLLKLFENFTAPEGAGDEYQSISGWFTKHFERLPEEGDALTESGWSFEIIDMDGARVDKVLASRATDPTPSHPHP